MPLALPLRVLAGTAGLVVAVIVGAALAFIGDRFGVVAMTAVPLAALLLTVTVSRPQIAIALILASIPIGLKALPIGFVVVQGVAIAAVTAVMIVRLARGRAPVAASAPLIWGVVVLALCFASTPHALDGARAVKQDIDVVLGLLVVGATMAVTQRTAQVRRFVHLLLVVGVVIALLSLGHASSLHAVSGAQRVDNRLRGTFTEPNQFGGFSAIIVILAIGVVLGARSRAERWCAAATAALVGVAMLLALSRGAWIGFMLAGALLLVLLPQARRALAFAVVAMLVLVPLLGLFTPDVPQVTVVKERVSTLRKPQANIYDSRPAIWREAVREIQQDPVLGQGPGQFPVVSVQAASEAATVYADHAHNVLLTVAAEVGIPAALALVGFTLTMLSVLTRTVRRLRGSPDAALVAAVGASLAVVVGQGLVDFTLRNADIFLLLSVLVGLVLASARHDPANER